MSDPILNRTESIRLYCLDCTAGSHATIRDCSFEKECALHPMRMGKTPAGIQKNVAIRKHCRSCIGEAPSRCGTGDCSLFPFRMGLRTETRSISEVFTSHVYVMGNGKRVGMEALRKSAGDTE